MKIKRVILDLLVVCLFLGWFSPCSVQLVQLTEGRLRPDTEPTHMATRSQFQQVKAVDIDQGDARDVTESTADSVILVVDHYRTTTLDTTAVSQLSNTCTESA